MSALDRVRPLKWASRAILAGVLLGTLGLALLAASATAQQPNAGGGVAECLDCHEEEDIMGILETPHVDFEDPHSPESKEQCEICHGPTAAHLEDPMQIGNIGFAKHGEAPIAQWNETCLECHDVGEQGQWDESAHGQNIACANCHSVHKYPDPILSQQGQAERCGACHTKILATAPPSAPHRLTGENAMACTLCHDPHGPMTLAGCVECHQRDAASLARQPRKARGYHERAVSQNIECTACHKGFVHQMPPIDLAKPLPGS